MAFYHVRSNSLPSTSNPLVLEFDEHFNRFKSSEATTSSSSSSSLIRKRLSCLKDLHDHVDDLLLLPHTQKALSQECGDRYIDELLDGSLRLLDVCGAAKDALSQMKESTHKLQSIIRRRRGSEICFSNEIRKYLTSRKDVKNAIRKALKTVRSKCSDKSNETPAIISTLREVEPTTMNVFESLLSFVAWPKQKSKWSLASKLLQPKRVACEAEEADTNELEKVDAALLSLLSQNGKSDFNMHVENVQNCLGELEANIQDLEEGVEYLSRRLIKSRVLLLNIFNH